jgi:fluoride exporter
VKLLWIAAAGALGTLARYWVGGAVQRFTGASFPAGTFVINLVGCFFFGLIWALTTERFNVSGETRMIVLLGFMGAFTTFSSFIFETLELLKDSEWLLAGLNMIGQNVLGLIGLFLGWTLGRMI